MTNENFVIELEKNIIEPDSICPPIIQLLF